MALRRIRIDPTGSEVPATLAQSGGRLNVSANVYRYGSEGCAGAGGPKAASTFVVTVDTNTEGGLLDHLEDVWKVFRDSLLIIIGGVFALIFGWLIARIKRGTKSWTVSRRCRARRRLQFTFSRYRPPPKSAM
ncbi:hypothetical protein [Salinisphaera aquimarina]|uniref:Uncharacterized protein n=1 Tax=Salinisphaera aquimarina TaxID=2094031 RepID=A0ABV7EKB3_9GAMM